MRIVAINWRDLAHPLAGGAELVVDRLLTGFADRGHEVALVCGGPLATHEYTAVDSGGTYDQYLRAPWICQTKFKDADVVIDASNGVPFFSPLWRRGPSVCLMHHVHTEQWATRFPSAVAAGARVVERYAVPAAYRNRLLVAVSTSTSDDLQAIGFRADQIRVIESGVDNPPVLEIPKSPSPLFVALARLVPHKRVELLLETWRQVHRVTGGRFVVIGDGPQLDALRTEGAGIPGLEFTGWVDDTQKAALLQQAWFLVHGAHHEGWGMVIVEAGSVGTPALALDAPGVRDSIVDGVTGWVVGSSAGDPTPELAQAWIRLAGQPETRRRLGEGARQFAARHSWDAAVDAWVDVLNEAVAGTPERPQTRGVRRPPAPVARGEARSFEPDDALPKEPPRGVRRMATLLRGFRNQFDDPDEFYRYLADDTVGLVGRYQPLAAQRVLDVGGGAGYFAEAFRRASAQSVFIEPLWDEMTDIGRKLGFGIVGDGCALPIADGSVDVSFSSNVIEHVENPWRFMDELIRVVTPGGLVFVAFTNWLSPFGGHETSPWHYLGGEWSAKKYEKDLGYPPKNRFGTSLYSLSIAEVLHWVRNQATVELLDAFPRYYPRWARPIVRVPGVREVVTWNLAVALRRVEP